MIDYPWYHCTQHLQWIMQKETCSCMFHFPQRRRKNQLGRVHIGGRQWEKNDWLEMVIICKKELRQKINSGILLINVKCQGGHFVCMRQIYSILLGFPNSNSLHKNKMGTIKKKTTETDFADDKQQ